MKKMFACILFLISIFILFFMVANQPFSIKAPPKVTNGLLDLRNLKFDSNYFLSLDGEWEFVGHELLTPADFSNHDEIMKMKVPGPWGEAVDVGTYRLTILLPKGMEDFGYRIRNIWSSHIVYINGEKVSERGIPSKDKSHAVQQNVPYEQYGVVDSNVLEIVISVSNFSNIDGGIIRSIDFGTERAIVESAHFDYTNEWTAIVLLLIFSLYHMSIFIFRQKEATYLYSGLNFFCLALMISCRNERILSRIVPDLPFELLFKLQDLTTYGSGVLFLLFLFKVEPKLISRKLFTYLLLPIILYLSSILLFPARSTSNLQEEVMFYTNILLFVLLTRLIWMAIKQQSTMYRNEAWILSCVLLLLFIFAIGGSLDALRVVGAETPSRLGLLGFVVMMNVFLAVHLNNRTKESEKLTISLRNSNAIKDEFLAVTSHELKAPIHGILNITKDLKNNNIRNLTNRQIEQLAIVEQTTAKLTYLVNDLQDFTKMRYDDLELRKNTIDVRVLTEIVFEVLTFDFEYKQIEFKNEISPNTLVHGDEGRFRQVLYNVLHNAVTYTEEGTVSVKTKVKDGFSYIYISDTGIGIKNEIKSSVFEFLYSENSRINSYNNRAMGLGLFISKKLLNNMGGDIWIEESEEDRGTVMGLKLPTATDKIFSTETVEKKNRLLKKYSGYLEVAVTSTNIELEKVLIVDDDIVNIKVLMTILQDNYTPIQAFSGLQALQLLSENRDIKFVITDVMMPGMSGIELTRRIREQYSLMELPIILATDLESSREIAIVLQNGANDYITKPFTSETVKARLNAIQQIRDSLQQALKHEMSFLQAQIKPHFLYNALSNIISFCYIDGERAAHLLTMLSSYLRYIFQAGRDGHVITLNQEIEVIHAYVTIEQARFGDRLSYRCEIDKSLLDKAILIPSLLLQPLLENAIRHGIFEKEGHGEVVLTISEQGDYYQFEIKDNGVGMSKKKLEAIRSGEHAGGGIGLNNVRRRIRQMDGASFSIKSEEGIGTEITILLESNILKS